MCMYVFVHVPCLSASCIHLARLEELIHAWVNGWMDGCTVVRLYVCIWESMFLSTFVSMYLHFFASVLLCFHVSMSVFAYMHAHTYACTHAIFTMYAMRVGYVINVRHLKCLKYLVYVMSLKCVAMYVATWMSVMFGIRLIYVKYVMCLTSAMHPMACNVRQGLSWRVMYCDEMYQHVRKRTATYHSLG